MARIRYLKPEFFKDDDLACLPFEVRLFYAGLWGVADKAGRLEDRAARLKAEIFPYDAVDAEKCLRMLAQPKKGSRKPFIDRYEVNGERYIQILAWEKHQKPHHCELPSIIPTRQGLVEDNAPYPSDGVRKIIYARDKYTCLYCGAKLAAEPHKICLDHIIPMAKNGSNFSSNLATACKKCNAKKADKLAEEVGLITPKGLGSTVGQREVDHVSDRVDGRSTTLTIMGNGELITGNGELKEKKKQEKKRASPFVPPTVAEVEEYCKDKGYTVNAKQFIEYYEVAHWHDAKGNPVKNWKQKIISVWSKYANGRTTENRRNTENSAPADFIR